MSSKKTSEPSPAKPSTARFSLVVQYASAAQNLPTRAQLRRWIKAALQRDVSMTLRIVDEDEGLKLNKSYRGKNYATNVLTFVYDDTEPTHQTPLPGGLSGSSPDKGRLGGVALQPLCGDAVICAPVVEKEAIEQHKDLLSHYAHLAIHAALHLQGYDHESDTDAEAMETLETAIMLKLHHPDPYQESRNTHGRSRK